MADTTLNNPRLLGHKVSGPEMMEGCPGRLVVWTVMVLGAEAPQTLFATTDIVPLLEPAMADMVSRLEAPVHPGGSVQV